MDTSKKYIKMCDCPEIQGFRYYQETYFNWVAGDWYMSIRPKHLERVGPLIWSEYLNIDKFKEEDLLLIWLPRQDQIQEMLDCNKNIQIAFHRLYQVTDFWIGRDLKSMEQLWLAFYMLEKHQKSWGKKGWINEKNNSSR